MATIKYIKNPPSIEDLENLVNSNIYQTLLNGFQQITGINSWSETENRTALWNILAHRRRDYLHLNIPIEEIYSEFEQHAKDLLNYTIIAFNLFNKNRNSTNQDGEFLEGEEKGRGEKSVVVEMLGLTKTLFLNRFCEFYLLKTNDKERLANFLKFTRMPYAKKHQTQITKLYKEITKAK